MRLRETSQGRTLFLQAGTFHYFRLPHPDLWQPALSRLRLSGFNAVVVPMPWAYHSPAPGFYDFTGPRDVARLMDAIEQVGLWAIPHIGPWIGEGLDAGGIPAWAFRSAGMVPDCEEGIDPTLSHALRRHLSAWWSHLLKVFVDRESVLFLMMDAGRCASGISLEALQPSLLELAEALGAEVPCAFPNRGEETPSSSLSWVAIDAADAPSLQVEGHDWVWVNVEAEPVDRNRRPHGSARAVHTPAPRDMIAVLAVRGCSGYALTPAHAGVTWGWWGAPPRCEAAAVEAPIPEDWTPSAQSLNLRRLCLTAETFASIVTEGQREPNAYASPPEALRAARSGPGGTLVAVGPAGRRPETARVSLGTPDRMLMTEDIPLLRGCIRMLPLNWTVAGGRLLTTTMEPVLSTSVASRHLLVLRNEGGGTLTLSDDFRLRHQRGPVKVERGDQALIVRMRAARLISLVLSGPYGPLQLLALDEHLANRVWPLDDRWRATPHRRAAWNPGPEEPARGVVIGPDFVLPQADGGYHFLVQARGLGYRWGPWRGSDPRTWLAPVSWQAPHPLELPDLKWTSHRCAPEALPEYPDQAWQSVAVGASLSATALDVGYGFLWYRAHFTGDAESAILRCPDACDLFLNGSHVAALSTAPEAPVTTKRIPLPQRHLRSENVLAFLVEHGGRPEAWDLAARPHGILSCELEGSRITEWRVRQGLSGSVKHQGFEGFADWDWVPDAGTADIVWHRATFDLAIPDEIEVSLALRLENTPRRAYLYLNGRMIGQTCHPPGGTVRIWLPESVLHHHGHNEMMIAQWTRGASPGLGRVRLEASTPLRWHRESRVH